MSSMESKNNNLKIWSNRSARKWTEAYMIGNGTLGAMIFGSTTTELIQFNEDTLWAGYPRDYTNPEALENLEISRKLIFEGKYSEAQKLIEEKMVGKRCQPYLPLSNLKITLKHRGVYDYRRELDLDTAISTVQYRYGNTTFRREMFASYPDHTISIRLTASKPKKLDFILEYDSKLKSTTMVETINDKWSLEVSGRAPSYIDTYVRNGTVIYEPEKGMRFHSKIILKVCDGIIRKNRSKIEVSSATTCELVMVAATSFNGPDKNPYTEGKDEIQQCINNWDAIKEKSYSELLDVHLKDYQDLYHRVDFSLGENLFPNLSTNKRLKRVQTIKGRHPLLADIIQAIGKVLHMGTHKENVGFETASENFDDLDLIALYFQFGRYLMISSSRKGSQPINLQGIWNDKVQPPWGSNYTTNINTEMNYWPVEVCNLSECFEPLLTLIRESAIKGAHTAEINYGAKGWVLHHNSNLWRMTEPSFGSASWAFWPMGGGWLCQNLFEHYQFTQDLEFLRNKAYPLMRNTAVFFLDWLIKKDEYLVTCPSTSPETGFYDKKGRQHNVHYASTCDMTIIHQHYRNTIAAAQALDIDIEFQELLQEKLIRLYPYQIGKYGHLQEWAEDFEDLEMGHRHMSHLIGVFPGNLLTQEKTPKLFHAARRSIDRRIEFGGGATGWSCAWKINLLARFKDPDATYNAIATILRSSTYLNLFDCHPPFQIDGNFGATAGIAECLLQSHEECIDLLPAMPSDWITGHIHGIKSRGNVIVDIDWKDGKLTQAKLHIPYDGEMVVRRNLRSPITSVTSEGVEIPFKDYKKDKIIFQVKPGKTYILR